MLPFWLLNGSGYNPKGYRFITLGLLMRRETLNENLLLFPYVILDALDEAQVQEFVGSGNIDNTYMICVGNKPDF